MRTTRTVKINFRQIESFISEKEAKDAVAAARKYLRIISEDVENRHPQLKLFWRPHR